MMCPNCEIRELVVIGMVISGKRLALNSCSSCDLRWWETREGNLSLAGVLDLVTVGKLSTRGDRQLPAGVASRQLSSGGTGTGHSVASRGPAAAQRLAGGGVVQSTGAQVTMASSGEHRRGDGLAAA